MNQTHTAGDAVITLKGVEADEEFVVIRFSVQDLKDDRRNAGKPAALEPVLGTGPPKRFRRTSAVSPTKPAEGWTWSAPKWRASAPGSARRSDGRRRRTGRSLRFPRA
jgi:hypothetical protein